MDYSYGCDEDYLDEDDDGIMYSTRNYCSDSDDETSPAKFFQKTAKNKTLRKKFLGQESDSEDDFEKEMSSELSVTMQKLTAPLLNGTSGTATQSESTTALQPEYYDDIYFDSEDSSPEESSECPQSSKSKLKRRILTNDELLYDPNMDDEDQAWVDKIRRTYQLHGSRRLPKAESALKPKPLPHSDAVLNCPACFTTLCLDCQRHEIYKDQYRAMFVFNCRVDPSESLHFSKKEDKKKFKKSEKKKSSNVIPEMVGSGMTGTSCSSGTTEVTMDSNESDINMTSTADLSEGIDGSKTNAMSIAKEKSLSATESSYGNDDLSTDKKNISTITETVVQNGSVVDAFSRKDEDLFHPVKCTVCGTKVAVYDKDEVYHFFNIITSY